MVEPITPTRDEMKRIVEKGERTIRGRTIKPGGEQIYAIIADNRQKAMDAYLKVSKDKCLDYIRYDVPKEGIDCICKQLEEIKRDEKLRQEIGIKAGITPTALITEVFRRT